MREAPESPACTDRLEYVTRHGGPLPVPRWTVPPLCGFASMARRTGVPRHVSPVPEAFGSETETPRLPQLSSDGGQSSGGVPPQRDASRSHALAHREARLFLKPSVGRRAQRRGPCGTRWQPQRIDRLAPSRSSAETRGPGPGVPRGYLVDPASSICLSQRLSHASLSTHGRYSETANGSLNQLWFL